MKAFKKISLSKERFTIVDEADFDWLSKVKWHETTGYAARRPYINKKSLPILWMHKEILKPEKGFLVDHINGNKLDNRRCNLRLCTRAENACNRTANQKNRKYKYKGIFPCKKNRWRAAISVNKKRIYLGGYATEYEAALAYDKAALQYHGAFARLNFNP